jgi:hypothetical protein
VHRALRQLIPLTCLALLVGCSTATGGADPDGAALEAAATVEPVALTPPPAEAYDDIPSRPECQMGQVATDAPPMVCEFGDPDAEYVVMVVGDSKAVQWRPAFEQPGWRVIQVTKSACAFADVMTVRRGAAWTDCRRWGRQVLGMVLAEQPDLVLTSQRRPEAMTGEDPADVSDDAMVDGLVSYWSQVVDAGIELAVLLDNPGPEDFDVPECLIEHDLDPTPCGFDTAERIAGSATPVQLAAAERVPGVVVLDLNRVMCPEAHCSPVTDDGLLIFRQGTHVTATYAATMAPVVAELLGRSG